MIIRESGEMYLETILVLSKKGKVRSIDVAKAMGYSRPSVSVTVHALEREGYIEISEKGIIKLLPKGLEIAEEIYDRHVVLTNLLIKLGIDEECATRDACKMEHAMSHETFEKIKDFFEKNNEKLFGKN